MNPDWLKAKKIDAFAVAPYTGNPAGLVVLDSPLDDAGMQAIAREMNLSETVFVLPDPVGDADWRLRYYTPTAEIPLCGHATIATLHHLVEEGSLEDGATTTLSTRSGILNARIQDGTFWTTMAIDDAVGVWPGDVTQICALLGIPEAAMAPSARPVQLGKNAIALEVADVATLNGVRPDVGAIRRFEGPRLDMLIPFATSGCASGVTWHQRVFAPNLGIDEDPVTGVATAMMAGLLHRLGRFTAHPGERSVRLVARQGDTVGRAGEVAVDLVVSDGKAGPVWIGGTAITTLSGFVRRPS